MAKRILLIEDFPVIQKLYGDYLRNHGYDVDVVPDGTRALEAVEEQTYDFVLVDMLLPKVNGIQFLEKFTNRPEQTKVFALSDFNDPASIQRANELGIEEYLIKVENTPSQLLEKLNSYADKPRAKDSPPEAAA